jgi:hypothetical protein
MSIVVFWEMSCQEIQVVVDVPAAVEGNLPL